MLILHGACRSEPEPLSEWETGTGLRVAEWTAGEGEPPNRGDIVSVVYTASYVDGDVFDSYTNRERPYQFRAGLGNVLPGFDEGVMAMPAGSRRVFTLPPHLAFEAEGKRPDIVPEGAWVQFDVELLEIEPGPPAPKPWDDTGREILVSQSGMQYVDFVEGEGDAPELGGVVVIDYNAFLEDGYCFDSTVFGGRPLEFRLDPELLIPGLVEGLLTMRAGGRRKMIIPPDLGYGKLGHGKYVPPDATLTFDVYVVEVK